MQINYSPRMTACLVQAGVFASEPLTVVDVGALGGIQGEWGVFGEHLRVIAFEPNSAECARLQAGADPRVRYLPYALGAREEMRTLYVHRNPSSSTIYPYREGFAEQFTWHRNAECTTEVAVPLRRLDDILADTDNVDFIKLDAEGAELDIMNGGRSIFARPGLLGVKTEVRFHSGFGTPLFWEVDRQLREFGFELYGIDAWASSRRALPYPHVHDVPHDVNAGERVFGNTVGGQILGGDAIYLRPGVPAGGGIVKVLKLAALMDIFEQADSAGTLILANAGAIDRVIDHRRLLDALVPPARGHSFRYVDHMHRYYEWDPVFRPVTPGKRYPDRTVDDYDGVFIPRWDFTVARLATLAWGIVARRLKGSSDAVLRSLRQACGSVGEAFMTRLRPVRPRLRRAASVLLPAQVKRWLHEHLGL